MRLRGEEDQDTHSESALELDINPANPSAGIDQLQKNPARWRAGF